MILVDEYQRIKRTTSANVRKTIKIISITSDFFALSLFVSSRNDGVSLLSFWKTF